MNMLSFARLMIRTGHWPALFDLTASGIAAAVAIFAMKRWSYPVLLAIYGWGFIDNIETWRHAPHALTLFTLVVVNGLNIAFASYFLLPAVRATYFDPKLRWWESKPRFKIDIIATVNDRQESICDISAGGVFVRNMQKLTLGSTILLRFGLNSLQFDGKGRVVHLRNEGNGAGIQFIELNRSQKRQLTQAMRELEASGVPRQSPKVSLWEDFKSWSIGLVTTGKGWAPELPTRSSPPVLTLITNNPDDTTPTSQDDGTSGSNNEAA
jgi:hypothetical protein